MKKLRLFLLAPFVLAGGLGSARASIPQEPARWIARYEAWAGSQESVAGMAVTPDGSTVIVTGSSADGVPDYSTVAYSVMSGDQVWTARFRGPAHAGDRAAGLVLSPDGSKAFVTGSSYSVEWFSSDIATVAYDVATGTESWVARYSNDALSDDTASAIAVSPDGGRAFVLGESSGALRLIAYDSATGAVDWIAKYRHPGPLGGTPRSVGVSADGSTVFAATTSSGSDGGYDFATIAYSAGDGAMAWQARYDGPASGVDEPTALVVSPDGSKVIVTGESEGMTGAGIATVAYSATTGAQEWVARHEGLEARPARASGIQVSPDGSVVYVAGATPDPLSYGSVEAGDLATSPNYDFLVEAYEAQHGTSLWSAQYDAANDYDEAKAIALSPDGKAVYVTGLSFLAGSYNRFNTPEPHGDSDYATVAFDARNGSGLWATRYQGPTHDHDVARMIAVSPDGASVFVAGESFAATHGFDFLTLAYPVATCDDGHDEAGPVSSPVHQVLEPEAGPATPYVHGADCDLIVRHGL